MDENELQAVRRQNLRRWIASKGGVTLALQGRAGVPKSYPSYLSQLMSDYSFGSRAARNCELRLGMPSLWLDAQRDDTKESDANNVDAAPDLRPGIRVPVVGGVKAGPDGYMEELQYPSSVGEGFVEYWTPDKAAYALRVKGDSMHPRYRAGEFIVVTPSIEPQPGRDVVVKLRDGQKLLKQLNWIRGGEIQLLSINNGYSPMTIDLHDVESIHRVGGSVPSDAFYPT